MSVTDTQELLSEVKLNGTKLENGNHQKEKKSNTTNKFNNKTYYPDERFSSTVVSERLSKSILHEFSDEEAEVRIQLAAVYRLYGKFGWTDSVYNHTTARVHGPNGEEHYLINAMGLNYEEVTASSLIKVDLQGNIIHPGVIGDIFGLNKAGLVIHSAVHASRPDVVAVSHTHQVAAAGISATADGFVELTQNSHITGPISYHNYEGIVIDTEEQKRLVNDMGQSNVLFLRNHGILTAGKSIPVAFMHMFTCVKACEMQMYACTSAMTREKLLIPSDDLVKKTQFIASTFSGETAGVLEFCAFMRMLDKEDPSYRN